MDLATANSILSLMPLEQRSQLPEGLSELLRIRANRRLTNYRPYAKQSQFHELGATHRIRALFGANQSGKSICGGAETAMHLTGLYPKWWVGHRFEEPIDAWAAGETGEATRDNAASSGHRGDQPVA